MQENAVCGNLSRQESAKNLALDSGASIVSGAPESVNITEFSSDQPAADSAAFSELALIVSAWPRLPEHIRQAILLLADAGASPARPSALHYPIERNGNGDGVNVGAGGGGNGASDNGVGGGDGVSGNGNGDGNGDGDVGGGSAGHDDGFCDADDDEVCGDACGGGGGGGDGGDVMVLTATTRKE